MGWLYECYSHDALTEFVGGEPVLNKFACVVKQKPDGSLKHRIIVDSKQSMVTAASRKMFKAVLPRATNLINDIVALVDSCGDKEEVEAFVLDADDAFWQIPLAQSERRFYCAVLNRPNGRKSYLAYKRTAQGS